MDRQRQNDECRSRSTINEKRKENYACGGPAGEIRGRETGEDRRRYQIRRRLAPHLIKKENGQNGNSNTESCQRQAVKTDLVSVEAAVGMEPAPFLITIGINVADEIGPFSPT